MYQESKKHLQIPLTSHVDEMPENLRKRLENSWAGMFYREFFMRLNERLLQCCMQIFHPGRMYPSMY